VKYLLEQQVQVSQTVLDLLTHLVEGHCVAVLSQQTVGLAVNEPMVEVAEVLETRMMVSEAVEDSEAKTSVVDLVSAAL